MRATCGFLFVFALFVSFPAAQTRTAKTLDIYYIDVEGGQSTLFVSPSGESLLVDTGSGGGRDSARILETLTAAGITQLDYLLLTHYHGDHIGGFPDLVGHIPIRHFVDHGPTVEPERSQTQLEAWAQAYAKGVHIVPKPGDKIPIAGLDWTIVTAGGNVLKTPMAGAPGAGRPNPYCADFKPKSITVDPENAQSVGSVVTFGKFRTYDPGDLTWNKEFELMCPNNRIGSLDTYLTANHGLDVSGSAVLVHGLQPRVVILNNGTRKGGSVEAFQTIHSSPGLEDLWQLHWSYNGGIEQNSAGLFIANVDDAATLATVLTTPPPPVAPPAPARGAAPAPGPPPGAANAHKPAYWLKVSAQADGTFTVTNPRNGFSKTYKK
jgi:competence protein ComEC